ncbi:MAPEG family protein [Undibacterium sp. CY18W]|uniref:MAPEG family protein n=1 Tax=Undibacterium hunanense TaxID=2762292 RepID=A0ABR6ZWN2_9BURK|nr:MAPEG family protein [Undibacterium hunanense]MBC3920272.1 MAPEG family protein [Undibacterium hunanense]
MQLLWTSWLTVAVLGLYLWIIYKVGNARATFQIKAPAVDGPPEFLRVLRVHANTVEQMVLFFPALWLCALWTGDKLAAALGLVWLVGRFMYAVAYYSDASKRSMGFMISLLAALGLLLAAMTGMSGVLK